MRLSQAAQETYQYELDCGTTHANALARAHRVMNAERILSPYGFRMPTVHDAVVSCDDRCNPIMQSEVDAALASETECARLYFGVDDADCGL